MQLARTIACAFLNLAVLASSGAAQAASQIHSNPFSVRPGGASNSASSAPEVNPGLFAAGTVLLVGGTLILLARRRTRRVPVSNR